MVRLAENIKQRRHEIDVTDSLLNGLRRVFAQEAESTEERVWPLRTLFLSRRGDARQAVAVIARVHNDRVITQAQSFQATKNGARRFGPPV